MRREMRTRGPSNDNKHSSSPSRARSSSNQQQMLLAQAMDFSTHRRRLLVERLQRSMAAGEQQKHQQQQQRFMEVAHLHPGGIGHNLQHEQAGKGHLARNVHGGPIAGSRRSSPNRFASKRGNNNSGSSAARHRNIINDAARAVVAGHSRFEIGRLRQGGFDEMQHRIGMGQFGALNADTEMRKLFLQHEQVKAMDAQAARERAAYTIERAEMTMRQLQAAAERDPYAAAASHVAALEAKERRGAEVQQGQMQTLTAAALAHAALVAEQEARMRDSRTHGNGSSPNINPRTAPRESDRAADSHGGLSSSRRRMLREFLKNGLSCANDGSSPNADTGNNNLVTAAAENNHNHSILDVVRKHPEPGVMNQQAPQHAKIECEDDRQKQENRQIREALHQARDERWKMDADAVADSIHLVDKSAPVVPILPSWFEQMQHYTIPRMQYSQQQDQHQQRRISPPSRALQLYRNSPSRYRSRQPPKLADAAVAEAERRIGRIVHEKLTREQHWRQVRDPFVSMRPTQPAHQPFCAPGTQKSLQQRKEEKEEEDRNGGATASADPNRVKYGFPWQRYSWRDVDLDKEYPPLVAGDELKQPKRKSPEHHQAASSSTQRDAAQADVTIAAAGGGHNYVEAHAKLSAAVAQQVSRLRRGEEEHRRQKKQQLDMQQRMLRLQRSYTPQPKSTSPAAAVTTPAAAAAQVSMSAVTVARPTTGGGSTPPQPKAAAVTNARASSNEGRHHSTAAYSGAAAAVVHQKSLDQPAHEQEQLPAREQQKQQSMVQPNRRGSIEEIKNNNSNSVSAAAGQRGSRASSASSSPLCHTLNSTTVTNSVATEARQRDSFVILSSQDSLVVSPAAPIPPSSAPEPLVPLFSGSAAASSAQRSKQQQETSTGSPTVVPLQEKGSSKPQLAAMLLSAQRASVPPPSSPAVTRVAPPSPLNEAKLRSLNIDDDDYDKEVDIFKRSADLNSASDAFRVEHHESKIREISLDNNSNNNNNGRRECTVIREYDLDNASNNDNSNRNEKNSSPAPQNQQQQQQQLLQSPVVRTQFSSDSPSREESPSNVDLLLPGDASKRGPLNPSSSVSSSSGAGLDCDIPIADWTKAADSAGAETPARSNASSGNEHHSCALARALRSQHGTATTTSSEREGSADSGSSIVDETDIQLQQQRPRPGGVAARTVAGL